MAGIRFGCGEFVPGGEPINIPSVDPPTPTTVVPKPTRFNEQIPPFIPPTGDPPKFACKKMSLAFAPPPPPGFRYKNGFFQECLPCDNALNTRPFGLPKNPGPNDPDCIFASREECDNLPCPNPFIREVEEPDPQEPPPAGGGGGGGQLGPTTGGGARFFRCTRNLFICPQDIEKEPNERRILAAQHICVVCNSLDPNGSNILQSQGPPVLKGNKAVQTFQSDCIYRTKQNCENACPPGPITGGRFVTDCVDPLSQAPLPPSQNPKLTVSQLPSEPTGSQTPVLTTINISQQVAQSPTLGISVNEPGVSINEPLQPNITNSQGQPLPSIQVYSKIFNNTFNFFAANRSLQVNSFSPNFSYPNIFKPSVASEVADLINNEGSLSSWRENTLFSLNLTDIELSLNDNLLDAFNTIHHSGGRLVGKVDFLEMVRKHLLTGTLEEFDSEYYIDLARKQKQDTRIRFTGIQDKDISERAGLGLVGSQAITADTNQLVNLQKRQVRRQRRLLTDIDARLTTDTLEDIPKESIELTDIGFDVLDSSGGSFKLSIGEGDGYYIPSELADGTKVPLLLQTDIENTFFVPPDTRVNALELFKEDSAYTLSVSAVSGQNELVAGDLGVSSLVPLYLTLDISSVTSEVNNNPLISRYTGRYVVENNQGIIDQHAKDNGLAVTRINIDYRDPIYRYILDGGDVSLALSDINFESILDPKDYPGGARIARNIPFGLIITPVVGSKFNPFNGKSTLDSFEEPFTRSLLLIPDIDVFDLKPNKPELEEVNLFNSTNGDLKVGLAEPVDTQNVLYKYDASNERYTETFFKNGEYTTSADISVVSSQGLSFMIKDVIDYIITTYDPEVISWYDVIRRMPLNRVGEFLYDSNNLLISELDRGFRSGVKINFILNTSKDILSKILSDDEKTIIKSGDR